ncbi:hypothetical protein ACQEVY_05755 [Streptomyces sp. CA-288835]|uniref:hypothetical protein n=1 Tax=Streptomyces sp. CA-288835 TaxID=3240069 RepID=UPI003D94FBB7
MAATPTFTGVTASAAGTKLMDITYAKGGTAARKATIQVGGQDSYVVALPPTGSATTYRTVSVPAHLAKGANSAKFTAISGSIAPTSTPSAPRAYPAPRPPPLVGSASDRCAT